jgi:hypothetical protein
MRIVLVSLLLLALPCWALAEGDHAAGGDAAVASAGGDWEAGCLNVPNGCSIDCIGIELTCCKEDCVCPAAVGATLRVEFMDETGAVIATGDVKDTWCDPCVDCKKNEATFGNLDNAIDPCKIATARLSVVDGPEAGINVKCLTLWLRDPQGRLGVCEKWYKAWKCCPECCQLLGGGTAWTFTSTGCCKQNCGCNKCETKCGCKDKCASKCGSCNKCETKCGCKSKCGSKCGGCNKCAKPKCGSGCKDKCGCKSKCGDKCGGCNKCAKPKCGCKDKCGCKSKCGDKCGGCNKCAKPKCGCKDKCGCKSKCDSKCGGCNKCAKPKCGCKDKCGCKSKCGDKCGKGCGCKKSKCGCGKC